MGLKAKFQGLVLGKVTGLVLHKAASGEYGRAAKAVYWWLAGHKTMLAAAIGLPTIIAEYLLSSGVCTDAAVICQRWETVVHVAAALSAAFAYLGQVDGALRLEPPGRPAPEAAKS